MPPRPQLRFNFGSLSNDDNAPTNSSTNGRASRGAGGGRGSSAVQPTLSSPLRPSAPEGSQPSTRFRPDSSARPVQPAQPGGGIEESKQRESDVVAYAMSSAAAAAAAAAAATAEAARAPSRAILTTERRSIDSHSSIETRTPQRSSAILRGFRSLLGQPEHASGSNWNTLKARADDVRMLRVDDTDNVLSKLVFGTAFKSKLMNASPATALNSNASNSGAEDEVEVDSDMSMGELANALRSAVARHLDADDWLAKLHDLFNAFDKSRDGAIALASTCLPFARKPSRRCTGAVAVIQDPPWPSAFRNGWKWRRSPYDRFWTRDERDHTIRRKLSVDCRL